jgi:hypothetical protein
MQIASFNPSAVTLPAIQTKRPSFSLGSPKVVCSFATVRFLDVQTLTALTSGHMLNRC